MRASRPRKFGSMLNLRRLCAVCLSCAVLLVLALIALLFTPPMPEDLSPGRADLRLAAWLSVSWSMSAPEAAEVMKLTERLAALAVDDVYVYVSYLKPDGTFNLSFDYASEFVAALKTIRAGLARARLDWRARFTSRAPCQPVKRLASVPMIQADDR